MPDRFISSPRSREVCTARKVENLNGQNGTISLRVRPDMAQNNADRLVIDGGRATGKKPILNRNAGNRRRGWRPAVRYSGGGSH